MDHCFAGKVIFLAIHPLQSERNKIATLALIAASLGGIASNVAPDILSALNLLRYQSDAIKASGAQIAASGMEKVRFYDSTSFYIGSAKMGDGDGAYYVDCVNDGLAELKKDSSQQETILSLWFSQSVFVSAPPQTGRGRQFLSFYGQFDHRNADAEREPGIW